jgi:beta-glucosidase
MLTLVVSLAFAASGDYPFPFLDPNKSVEERVNWLVNNLTLEEKVSQMMSGAAGIRRLNIPPYNWWSEGLHGVVESGNATVFPQVVGQAATFDSQCLSKMFKYVSDEGRAKHHRYLNMSMYGLRYHGITFWVPFINIVRDPRWGRGQETFGEDPFLMGELGRHVVMAMQGDIRSQKYYKTHACAKVVAAHSGPESVRHKFNVNPTKRDLAQTYLPAFKVLVDAGVREIMCAYTALYGQPACASDVLHRTLQKWNFSGIVVSDCGAINDFWTHGGHRTHPDPEHASADAVRNGTVMECGGGSYRHLVNAVHQKLIGEDEIDNAVRIIFRERIQLGMFDPPDMVNFTKIPYSVVCCEKHTRYARLVAQKSIVLLKNDGILPLDKSKVQRLLVVGPNADNVEMLWANYHGYNFPASVTILEGLRNVSNVVFAPGCEYLDNHTVGVDLWMDIKSLGRIGFEGRFYPNMDLKGEPTLVKHIDRLRWLDGGEASLGGDFRATHYSAEFNGTYAATATETLEVIVSFDRGAKFKFGDLDLVDDWNKTRGGSVNVKVNVTSGQKYNLWVAYRHSNGRARFDFTIKRILTINQSLEDVTQKAKDSDAIVFVGGIWARLEGEEMHVAAEGFSGGDRTIIELPHIQREFLEALKMTGKPVIFVLCQGSASAFNTSGLAAVLDAFYPGQAGGTAVADVIFGDYNPAGRLPVTFYENTSELLDFKDYNMSTGKGRTYRYYKGKPLFPFGYGLSYTKFKYTNLKIHGNILKDKLVNVSFSVKNIGKVVGEEVSQIYVSALDAQGEPIKALKWFKRYELKVEEEVEIVAELNEEAFMIYDELNDTMVLRAGRFKIGVGGSSDDNDLIVKEVKFEPPTPSKVPHHKGFAAWKIGAISGAAGLVVIAVVIVVVLIVRSGKKEGGIPEPLNSGALLTRDS